MIGLDTNVLVTWIVEGQSRGLPQGDVYRVSHVALSELVWVLRERFSFDKSAQVQAINRLLSASNVEVDRAEVVRWAVAGFDAGGADFNDFMIASDNRAAGCSTTFTLDRQAARKPGFTLLRS